VHELIEAAPERGALYAGARQHFGFDELVELGGDAQAAALGHLGHFRCFLSVCFL
jgi:hypothetical protein